MKVADMNKVEKSLILFLETCCVDRSGGVNLQHMNGEDINIAKGWDEIGFISFKRIASEFLPRPNDSTYDCLLSADAWAVVSQLRMERAERLYASRRWKNIKEIKEVETA